MTNKEAIVILKPLFDQCKGINGCLGYIEHYFSKDEETALDLAIKALEERPHGEWIYHDKLNKYYCKDCGLFEPFTKEEIEEGVKLPNFCEQCGADMRGEKNE